jgi:hypothetical protein
MWFGVIVCPSGSHSYSTATVSVLGFIVVLALTDVNVSGGSADTSSRLVACGAAATVDNGDGSDCDGGGGGGWLATIACCFRPKLGAACEGLYRCVLR